MAIDAAKHDGRVVINTSIRFETLAGVRAVPVQIVVEPWGLQVRRRGRRGRIVGIWPEILKHLRLPDSAPAKYNGRPEGLVLDP